MEGAIDVLTVIKVVEYGTIVLFSWENMSIFFFKDLINLFLERGGEGERKGENHHWVVASCVPPTGDLACSPGLCPDWESNLQPFASQSSAQSTEQP